MEGEHRNSRRHHHRSHSAATPSVSPESKRWHATPAQANDLETIAYREARRRREVLALKREWSARSDGAAKRALHHKPVRSDARLRGFLDAARAYDQELMYLEFLLDGPRKVHYLAPRFAESAVASLRRAGAALAGAGWRIRRCVDLLDDHAGRDASRKMVWNEVLRRMADTGTVDVELQYYEFVRGARARIKPLLEALQREIPRMRWIVHHLDRNRVPLFVRRLKDDASRSNVPMASTQQVEASADTRSGSRSNEMSGVLLEDDVQRSSTCAGNLEAGSAAVTLQLRYQVLKAREKLRGVEKAEVSRAAWMAFREDLDNQTGPPSTDMILLRHRVDTNIILAERQIQQLGAQNPSESHEDNGGRTRDIAPCR
ncbi:hypothetical protein F5Y05DRAFT_417957 [Hypoxylon sp. FL0543]|nr:hypothetical protein F5Y05DRAFT_417957 [Hypoxylon sp. FL0543]